MSTTPTVKGVTGMPIPKSKKAPVFKPKHPEELKEFLEEFEGHAAACGLTTKEKAKVVVRYTDKEMGRFWRQLEGYDDDYDVLKKNILNSFSETQLDKEVTVNQLRRVIKKAGKEAMENEGDFNKYYHKFWTIATDLVKKKKITADDRDHYFWEGLPSSVCRAIRNRLEAHDSSFKRSEVPSIEKAVKEGRFVLTRDGVENQKRKKGRKMKEESSDEESSEEESSEESEESEEESSEEERRKRGKKGKKEVRTKKVHFEEDGQAKVRKEVDELTRKLNQLNVKDDDYASTYASLCLIAPAIADRIVQPARWMPATTTRSTLVAQSFQAPPVIPSVQPPTGPTDRSCHFCKFTDHHMRICPVAAEYIQLGQVILQSNGYYSHADGTRIARHPGGLKAAIDFKLGVRDIPPHISTLTSHQPSPVQSRSVPTSAITSFLSASEVEEGDTFVWGAVAELEEIAGGSIAEGLAVTRAQGRKEPNNGTGLGMNPKEKGPESSKVTMEKVNHQPAYHFESKMADPLAAQRVLDKVLEVEVPKVTVKDLLSLSGDLRKVMVENTRTQKAPTTAVGAALATIPNIPLEFSTPLREMDVLVMGKVKEVAVLDDGSEIVLVRKDLWEELGAQVNKERRLTMETASGGKQPMRGCAEWLEIEVGGLKTFAHAFVAPESAPFHLLLGRPWQKSVKLGKVERDDGGVDVVLTDPVGGTQRVTVATRGREEKGAQGLIVLEDRMRGEMEVRPGQDSLTNAILGSSFTYNQITRCLAYKKVANKVRPVPGTMPSDIRILRRFPEDPLRSLPGLSPFPPPFSPGTRLTQERMEALGLFLNEFLWPEEKKLVANVLIKNEMGLAWDESEKGRFRDDYFSPVKIPVVEHVPWTRKSLPIPPGIREKVIGLIRQKVETGVYEPSYSSYRHQWFTVAKKDGNVRIVHNLTPLNAVTIRDSQEPPLVYLYAEQCSARAIYSGLDLFVGYDHRTLAEESRDYTTFDTPLGTMRLSVLPQGWTGSVGIFHNDVAFILQDETDRAPNFLDDVTLLGPKSRYEKADGTYETITENPGIRRFVWEHAVDLNRVLHRLKHAGATVSAKKLQLCSPEIVVVGRLCTYEGQEPDVTTVEKIVKWPECRTISEVRGFLGMAGTVRNWIRNFAAVCDPLTKLTRVTKEEFRWGEEQRMAMEEVKKRISTCEAIRPIDHSLPFDIILSVDTSVIAVGYILAQLDGENRRRPARFGSISWNDRISRYSQAKLELYGLFRALNATKLWIISAKKLVVEVDAQYIKGMINKPDIHPNAAMNRWISAILLFDFELVHIPGAKHKGPDGLSRRRAIENEGEEVGEGVEEAEDWVDEVLGCGVWVAGSLEEGGTSQVLAVGKGNDGDVIGSSVGEADMLNGLDGFQERYRMSEKAKKAEGELKEVRSFLKTMKLPLGLTEKAKKAFLRRAGQFFVQGDKLWKRDYGGRHRQVIMDINKRYRLLIASHDQLGHKGFYATRRTLGDRFWWPQIDQDVRWLIDTCHPCQIHSLKHVVMPPVVQVPAPLFRKVYIDTMHLPPSHGHKYIVQARDSLTGWVEWRALTRETGRTLGQFIFEEILCRWGGLEEIVTDNGTPFVAALEWIADRYHIRHIRISAYNSQSNGVVETTHRTIRDSLVKICTGNIKNWYEFAPYIFWADRVTTRKATGMTPYYAVHGIEPLHPFDITEATFLVPSITHHLSDSELLTTRARMLQKRDEDLAKIHDNVLAARYTLIRDFKKKNANRIHDYNFKQGELVLVLNKKIEPDVGRKCKPRYFGPMVIVKRLRSGAYILAEVNGAVSRLKFAAFRIIPYHPRSRKCLEITEFVDPNDLGGIEEELEGSGVVGIEAEN